MRTVSLPGVEVTRVSCSNPKMDIRCLTGDRALVGESPVYSAPENAGYWVDILGPTLHRTDLTKLETASWALPRPVGMIALRSRGGLVIALDDGLYGFEPMTGDIDRLTGIEADRPENRANDGKCDVAGRLWVGTMNKTDHGEPTGSFYSVDAGLTARKIATDLRIPNGLAWSPDNAVMYHTDSRAGVVHAYDFDPATGERSGKREFFRFDREKTGGVDGAAMDMEGAYWTVLYGGGKLIRILPDGTQDREIPLPVTQPTMPCFAGPDMKTIVITSASQKLSQRELEAQPLAGALLAVTVDVPGHPVYPFGG